MSTITAQIKLRRDTSANWTSTNPTPLAGEICITSDVFYTGTDQPRYKIGDGTQTWTQLDYVPEGGTLSGLTTNKLIKATSATTIGNGTFSDDGTNLIVPSAKYITGSSGTKSQIDLNYGATDGQINISADGGTDAKGWMYCDTTTSQIGFNNTANVNVINNQISLTAQSGTGTVAINGDTISIGGTTLLMNSYGYGNGKVLTSNASGYATWQTPTTGTVTSVTAGTGLNGGTITSTGTIALNIPVIASQGGTGQTVYAVGDLLYSSGTTGTTSLARLADVAAGSYLRSGGTNTAPLWSTLVLPNSATANRLVYATSSNTWGESSLLTFNGTTFTANGITANASGLGIGTGSATSTNVINGIYNTNGTTQFSIQNTNTSTAARCGWNASNSTNSMLMLMVGTGYTTSGVNVADGGLIACGGTGGIQLAAYNASGTLNFYTGGTGSGNLRWSIGTTGNLTASDGLNIAVGTSSGTKIGIATSQKLGFWNATPVVQPTTAVATSTFVANTSGIVDDSATFGGYKISQIVKALQTIGILA